MDNSITGLCSLLDRISDTAKAIALFLTVEGYDDDTNYDICDGDTEIITLKANLQLDAARAKNTLRQIIRYEKAEEPENAKKAAELHYRIAELEKEINILK